MATAVPSALCSALCCPPGSLEQISVNPHAVHFFLIDLYLESGCVILLGNVLVGELKKKCVCVS